MILTCKTGTSSYPIVIEPGVTRRAADYLTLGRRVLIVTDSLVPEDYAARIAALCDTPVVVTVATGEGSKSIAVWEELLKTMLDHGFTRADCVIAVGGGVVGDLAGFAAASYMRGIDFYNIPTTVLSQVDSSVGGKTAVNFGGIKNIVGAFYPPKAVLIDCELLSTLPARQISSGLAEAVKMSLTSDSELFSLFETEVGDHSLSSLLPTIIERSIRIKKAVVEADEKEAGLRKILNFGHTIGHGIESLDDMQNLYHGECVALGMLPMCESDVRHRLVPVLRKLHLPTTLSADPEAVFSAMLHDKKKTSSGITVITVDTVGSYRMQTVGDDELKERLTYFREKEADK